MVTGGLRLRVKVTPDIAKTIKATNRMRRALHQLLLKRVLPRSRKC